jgi:hypothetical protein
MELLSTDPYIRVSESNSLLRKLVQAEMDKQLRLLMDVDYSGFIPTPSFMMGALYGLVVLTNEEFWAFTTTAELEQFFLKYIQEYMNEVTNAIQAYQANYTFTTIDNLKNESPLLAGLFEKAKKVLNAD